MSELKLVRSRFLEKLFAATTTSQFPHGATRLRLEKGDDLLSVARSLDLMDQASEEHFRSDWFAPTGYWGDAAVERVLREGFIDAFRMAEALNAPIRGYWLSGLDRFAVPVLPSPIQITLLVLTPPLEGLEQVPIPEGVLALLRHGVHAKAGR